MAYALLLLLLLCTLQEAEETKWTKQKMDRSVPMKTEQAWNGLYPAAAAADDDDDDDEDDYRNIDIIFI
jgi:hypothetical protein